MPHFSTELPREQKNIGLDLKRTPPAQPLCAIITCERFIVCDTHFFQGRTTPCERLVNDQGKTIDDSPCAACLRKQPWRTHVYLSCYTPKTAEHFLFECSPNAAKPLAEHLEEHGTLRGYAFAANRPKCGPNAKVVITNVAVNLAKIRLPNEPDIIKALSVIWRIPHNAVTLQPEYIDGLNAHAGSAQQADHAHIDAPTIAQMRTQPDDNPTTLDLNERRRALDEELRQYAKKNGEPKKETARK